MTSTCTCGHPWHYRYQCGVVSCKCKDEEPTEAEQLRADRDEIKLAMEQDARNAERVISELRARVAGLEAALANSEELLVTHLRIGDHHYANWMTAQKRVAELEVGQFNALCSAVELEDRVIKLEAALREIVNHCQPGRAVNIAEQALAGSAKGST